MPNGAIFLFWALHSESAYRLSHRDDAIQLESVRAVAVFGAGCFLLVHVRPDVSLENDVGDTLAYYDYKTGGATVSSRYANKVRSAGGYLVPVIQLSVTSGSIIKSRKASSFG
jgi:hypothetical protein